MDLNLRALPDDAKAKIYSFCRNTALWLVGQGKQQAILMNWLLDHAFSIANIEDVTREADPVFLGRDAILEIGRHINQA